MERSAPLKAKCKVTHSSPRNMRHGTPCRAMVGGGGHKGPLGDRRSTGKAEITACVGVSV